MRNERASQPGTSTAVSLIQPSMKCLFWRGAARWRAARMQLVPGANQRARARDTGDMDFSS
jgi:hypothetical protein